MTGDAHPDSSYRPWPIWVVSGYWIAASSYMLWFYLAVLAGRRTVPILDRIGVLTVLGILGLALTGAIALFLLKRVAFLLFLLAIVVITVFDTFLLLTTRWLQVLGPTGITNVVIGLILYVGTTVYAWRLFRCGTLQ